MNTSKNHPWSAFTLPVGVVLAVLAVSALSIWLLQPPSPLPADAPAIAFSAERAIEHSRVIAREPHPGGSPANEKVAQYLVQTLRDWGIDAELNRSTYAHGHSVGEARMVLARIPGTAPTKAFAMIAHYDSVPYGPGCTDDGGGVVAMLETARALTAGAPLKNDTIFVFTDSEESGMLGARAFTRHAWFDDVALMLNLEARGNQGTSFMFETSPGNGWLISQMAQACRYPCATSFMYDVYKRLPFNSDFEIVKAVGMPGYNIAFVDNFGHYHTKNDSPENASLASLQHHGSYALDLARHFGNMPLDRVRPSEDAMYFNTIGYHLARYPLSWGRPLAILAALMFFAALILGFYRRHLTLLGFLAGVGGFLVTALLAMAAVLALLVMIYGPQHVWHLYAKDITYLPDLRRLYDNDTFGTAFAAMTVGVFALGYGLLGRVVRLQNLAAGALLWWLIPLAVFTRYLPGGSYMPMWPIFFSSIGLALLFLGPADKELSPKYVAILTLFAFPGIFMLVPSYRAFLSTTMIITGPALSLMLALLLGMLAPQLVLASKLNRWWLPAAAVGLAVLLMLIGLAINGPGPTRPELNSVAYGLNHDTGEAFWMTADEKIDEWTCQFFTPDTPKESVSEFLGSGVYKKAPAPLADLPGAAIEVLRDNVRDNDREIFLRVTSENAARLNFLVTSATNVRSARIFDQHIDAGRRGWWGVYINVFPRDGVEILLNTDAAGPLTISTIEQSYGQPRIPGIRPRPDYMAPEPNTVKHGLGLRGDHIYVRRSFTFPLPSAQQAGQDNPSSDLQSYLSDTP